VVCACVSHNILVVGSFDEKISILNASTGKRYLTFDVGDIPVTVSAYRRGLTHHISWCTVNGVVSYVNIENWYVPPPKAIVRHRAAVMNLKTSAGGIKDPMVWSGETGTGDSIVGFRDTQKTFGFRVVVGESMAAVVDDKCIKAFDLCFW
jgi:hypothetical protein